MKILTALGVLLLAGCGGTAGGSDAGSERDAGTARDAGRPSLLGTWQTVVADVTITVTFSGTEASGVVRTVQSTPVDGEEPGCVTDLVGDGTFEVTGASIELDTPSGVQRTHGCGGPNNETPIDDVQPLQNFADALSGPFVLTQTTLQLGASYPMLTRVTR